MLGIWGGFAASMAVGRPMALAVVGPISVLLFFGGLMLPIALWQRDLRRVRTCQGQACLHCLYDLRSLPAEGHCPECGAPYTKADVVRQWRHADRSYQAKKLYTLDEEQSGE